MTTITYSKTKLVGKVEESEAITISGDNQEEVYNLVVSFRAEINSPIGSLVDCFTND